MERATAIEDIAFYEDTRMEAEAAYTENPLDADNLTKWGVALLELGLYQQPADAEEMVADSVSKFKEALKIDPEKSEIHWFLGNALIALTFFIDYPELCFSEARDHFSMACKLEPGNQLYHKSLETAKASSEYHAKLLKKGYAQQAAATATTKKGISSAVKSGITGFVIGALAAVVTLRFLKQH